MRRVTVYSKPNCPQCSATVRKLKQNNVQFDSVDLMEDPSALDFVKSLGYNQAPVVVVGETHWSGFRPDLIDKEILT